MKEYDLIISLGGTCDPKLMAHEYNPECRTIPSFPFDAVITMKRCLLKLLKTDFDNWIQEENMCLLLDPYIKKVINDQTRVIDKGTEMIFVHHHTYLGDDKFGYRKNNPVAEIEYDDFYDIFMNRKARLYDALNSNIKISAIRYAIDRNEPSIEFVRELRGILDTFKADIDLYMIYSVESRILVTTEEIGQWELPDKTYKILAPTYDYNWIYENHPEMLNLKGAVDNL